MRRALAPLALALLLAAPHAMAQREESAALRRIEQQAERVSVARVDPLELGGELTHVRHADGAEGRRLERALCTIAGTAWLDGPDSRNAAVVDLCLDTLRARLRGGWRAPALEHLATEILLRPMSAEPELRVGAALALGRAARREQGVPRAPQAEPVPATPTSPATAAAPPAPEPADRALAALVHATRDADERVRGAAFEALVDHPAQRALEVLAEELARAFAAEGKAGGKEERLTAALSRVHRRVAPPKAFGPPSLRSREEEAPQIRLPGALSERLAGPISSEWVAPDWRRASRAIALWPLVPEERAAIGLVGALGVWTRRGIVEGVPTGTARVRLEIAAALEALSGRSMGPYPDRWRPWLERVAAGEPLRRERGADESSGAFFGLHLRSGAVLFLLDASGSMAGAFPSSGTAGYDPAQRVPSRFERAVEELLGALGRAQEPVWFELLLFETRVRRFAPRPRLADAAGLADLRAWLAEQGPAGGTDLASGLAALWPDRASAPPFDTVVVLCDGETSVTAADARAFLAAGPLAAGVVVHAVQIGSSSAPALETLASASGGQFVRVGGF